MRKGLICAVAIATATVPAAASAKPKPDKGKDKPAYCVPKSVGYNAAGTYVGGTLTQTAGTDTAQRGDDRYSGDIVVDVKKANHKGATGQQTFTLTNARAKFHPHNDTTLAAGDRVKLSGKVTKVDKKCAAVTPTVTVRKVDFKAAKTPSDT